MQFANRIRFDSIGVRFDSTGRRRRDLAEVLQRAARVGHCKRAETVQLCGGALPGTAGQHLIEFDEGCHDAEVNVGGHFLAELIRC